MHVKVLLFAQLADALGQRELELELPDGATVAEALDQLAAAHDSIALLRDRIAVAVDETYVSKDHVLTNDSALALIPPVSGG